MTAKSSPGHWMHPNAQYMVNLDRNHFINPKKNPDMYNRIWLILSNQLYLIKKLREHKIPPVTFLLHRKSKNVGSWTTKDEHSAFKSWHNAWLYHWTLRSSYIFWPINMTWDKFSQYLFIQIIEVDDCTTKYHLNMV